MHELSIAHNILEIIKAQAPKKAPLKSIFLTVGPLSGVSPDALTFCLPFVADENGFGHPEVHCKVEKTKAECRQCGFRYSLDDFFQACPRCSSLERRLLSGEELTLDSIEFLEE